MTVERRPWPQDPRYLAGDDGTILGPAGSELRSTPDPDGRGYQLITIRRADGKRVSTTVHRVVCESFHGPCPPGMQSSHKDGHPPNCRPENLEWKTIRGNNLEKLRHGTHGFKLTAEEVREIRAQPGVARKELARRYGVSLGMISHIRTGHSWSALT